MEVQESKWLPHVEIPQILGETFWICSFLHISPASLDSSDQQFQLLFWWETLNRRSVGNLVCGVSWLFVSVLNEHPLGQQHENFSDLSLLSPAVSKAGTDSRRFLVSLRPFLLDADTVDSPASISEKKRRK